MLESDVLIVGSGPAGLQAAINASRRKLNVIVLGKLRQSSLYCTKIENLSVIDGVMDGSDILERSKKKAEALGVAILEEDAIEIEKKDMFIARTENDSTIKTKAVVIATGIHRNRLGVKGEMDFIGKGVAYCADCDAPFFKDKKVVVVGCGSAAAKAALLVKEYTDKIHLICERIDFGEPLRKQIDEAGIKILGGLTLTEISGDSFVSGIILKNGMKVDADGVLVELGARGAFELTMSLRVEMDEKNHILVNRKQMTNVPGLFAAGDICGSPYQVAKALGEGCVAGIKASEYVKNIS
jgi:thioredoxin reductase (NADPH)